MCKNYTILIIATALAVIVYTQITFFVIQPIGMVPEGKTLVITRLNKTQFIDSADGICEREQGGVNLLCRMAVVAGVVNNSTIIIRLPYSSLLYSISTGGKTYDR
jgi:hypothetical protein